MKLIPFVMTAAVGTASAANLMLDFGATSVASPYLNLSPAHDVGAIPSGDTTWNTISSSVDRSNLDYSDGSAATGITVSFGQESSAGNGTVDFTVDISNLALAGTGGGNGSFQKLLTSGSIYGPDESGNSAPGQDGVFGGGSGGSGSAAGMRIDGLAASVYEIYVMARNTNSNVGGVSMISYATSGASAGTFDYGTVTGVEQTNAAFLNVDYVDQYESFTQGENFTKLSVTVADGESLFLAVDGSGSDSRGFINSVQVVGVPEPSALMLSLTAGLVAFRRRR